MTRWNLECNKVSNYLLWWLPKKDSLLNGMSDLVDEWPMSWCFIWLSLHKQGFPGLCLVRNFKEKNRYQQVEERRSGITSENLTSTSSWAQTGCIHGDKRNVQWLCKALLTIFEKVVELRENLYNWRKDNVAPIVKWGKRSAWGMTGQSASLWTLER